MYKNEWRKETNGESTLTKEEFIEDCLGLWKLPTEKKRDGCPAPFPLELPKRCINLLTFKGNLVLDPFMGSGTTAVAAKMTGRHYIGFELSENYCNIARQRLEQTYF